MLLRTVNAFVNSPSVPVFQPHPLDRATTPTALRELKLAPTGVGWATHCPHEQFVRAILTCEQSHNLLARTFRGLSAK